jgi:hypothetical protein
MEVELGLKDNIEKSYELVNLNRLERFRDLWDTHNLDVLATEFQRALNLTELSPKLTNDVIYWPAIRRFLKK